MPDFRVSPISVVNQIKSNLQDRYDSGYPGAKNDPMTQLVATTVYVDAQC